MPKKRNKKQIRRPDPAGRQSSEKFRSRNRNHSLDVLRGVAILLMVVDHVAGILLDVRIEPTSIRILTRLSMPLFCVLMGYFLSSSKQVNWNRYFQLALATIFINLIFFTVFRKVEILASLLVCYSLYVLIGKGFAFLFLAGFFFQLDPSVPYFDYPLTVVAMCVAQGVILRTYGWRVASATGALSLLSFFFMSPPTIYILLFLLPATWLVAWGGRHPGMRSRWLEIPGRFPLTAYLGQYCIILAIANASLFGKLG